MALTVTALSPLFIAYDGGHRLELTGTFALGHRHRVYIGLTGTTADAACYSGVAGEGVDCYPQSATKLVAYSPCLDTASGQHVLIRDVDTAETVLLSAALTVMLASYYLSTFAMRSVLPPRWKTGPRSLDRLPPPV